MKDLSAEVTLDRPSIRDILLWGLEDWVDLGFARQYVSDEIGAVTTGELREQTLTVVSSLLDAGLMVAGDLRATGFTPWPLEPAAAVARLRKEWIDPEVTLHSGDLCWLQITEAGEALARRMRAER